MPRCKVELSQGSVRPRRELAAWDCGASRGDWRDWGESGNLRIGLGGG